MPTASIEALLDAGIWRTGIGVLAGLGTAALIAWADRRLETWGTHHHCRDRRDEK